MVRGTIGDPGTYCLRRRLHLLFLGHANYIYKIHTRIAT